MLLIDDQPMIGEAVRRMLAGEAGISFHFCNEARAALQAAADIAPTVILQDLVMPDIDGLQLVDMFRADDRFRDVPIIVLSAKEEAEVKADAFARVRYAPGPKLESPLKKSIAEKSVQVAVAREQQKAAPLAGTWSGPADAFERMEVSVQVVAL